MFKKNSALEKDTVKETVLENSCVFPPLNLADISATAIDLIYSLLANKFCMECNVHSIPYIFELDELSILITKHLIENSIKLREVGEYKNVKINNQET